MTTTATTTATTTEAEHATPERADLDAYAVLVAQYRERRHISLAERADICDALLNELRGMRAEIDGLKLVLKQVIAQATGSAKP